MNMREYTLQIYGMPLVKFEAETDHQARQIAFWRLDGLAVEAQSLTTRFQNYESRVDLWRAQTCGPTA
jgi:hypothetical protein